MINSTTDELTLILKASATSSKLLRFSILGPLLIAPNFASNSMTAGIQSSPTSVSTIKFIKLGEMTIECKRGCRLLSTAFSKMNWVRKA